MAIPRRVLPGRTYLVTRRCSERRFLLKPSPLVDNFLVYVLGCAATIFGVEIHGFVFLSNHFHLALTDHRGVLPRFCHWLHLLMARFLNAHYGRFESFWAPGSYSAVHLPGPEEALEKLAYLLANPTAAGLVAHGRAWPGRISRPQDFLDGQGVYRAKRPAFFFSSRTKLPDDVELLITCPPALADRSREEVVADLTERREALERAAREKLKEKEISPLGRKRILSQSPFDRPRSHEPRFQLSPNLACGDRWKRIEQLKELKAFRIEYRACFVEFRSGNRSVVFPEGTWGPVVLYGARVRGSPERDAA